MKLEVQKAEGRTAPDRLQLRRGKDQLLLLFPLKDNSKTALGKYELAV